MNYDFKNLSYADFEDLTRDLIGKELGVRFESFSEGPDGGIDGRHSKGESLIILQSKHYSKSLFSNLKNTMKRESKVVRNLNATRYILVTSQPLTPKKKATLIEVLGVEVINESDIFGAEDLNALIRKFPEIEKSHIKLWLTSVSVLEKIIKSASLFYNSMTVEEIKAKLKLYVPNPSVESGQEILEKNHLLIISGPPGVGKTTLAEVLAFAYISTDWELNSIRSLDDGFSAIDDAKKQMFFFDDFLGRVALDRNALSQKDSDLFKFLSRVRKSPHARFILTTRAYIFEEARRSSEHLASPALDISRYTLDVGIYTRRIKARILYNHLFVSKISKEYVLSLLEKNAIKDIVDHKNYNPRIIEWMTDDVHFGHINAKAYPEYFLDALNNPQRLWDTAFRSHISKRCQHLLMALFFCSEYGVSINELEPVYNNLHSRLCIKYRESYGPKDFEESLKILEGSFVSITNKTVSFINPSVKDYLSEYLADESLISEFPYCAVRTEWTKELWLFGKKIFENEKEKLINYSLSFVDIAKMFLVLPVCKRELNGAGYSIKSAEISNMARILLLLEWWELTRSNDFINCLLCISDNPVDGLDPWWDGDEVIELIYKLRDGDYYIGLSCADEVANNLEASLRIMLEQSIASDDLESISDAIDEWGIYLSDDINNNFHKLIHGEFNNVTEIVSNIDSESTLLDHIDMLKKLGKRSGLEDCTISMAIEIVDSRINEVHNEEIELDVHAPRMSARKDSGDEFDDKELINLFTPLIYC